MIGEIVKTIAAAAAGWWARRKYDERRGMPALGEAREAKCACEHSQQASQPGARQVMTAADPFQAVALELEEPDGDDGGPMLATFTSDFGGFDGFGKG